MSHQFKHTVSERKSSVVYSTSVGKGGLVYPNDFIAPGAEDDILDENVDVVGTEAPTGEPTGADGVTTTNAETVPINQGTDSYHSLLDTNNSRTLQIEEQGRGKNRTSYGSIHLGEDGDSRRKSRSSYLDRSLLLEERDLLIDNNLLDSHGRALSEDNQRPAASTGQSPSSSTEANGQEHQKQAPPPSGVIPSDIYKDTEALSDEISSDVIMETWEQAIESGKPINTSYIREAKVLAKDAAPLVFTFLLQNSLALCSVFSVSHLGTKELGGITLGSMTANITGLAAIQGLATCLDTLCSQAHGAKNYHLVGVLVQRCIITTILAFLPIIYIWWFWAETILSWMIPEKELCFLAARYLRVTALGVPGFIIFECGKRYLQCQGIFHASTIVLFICAPLNAILNYVLVWDKRIGIGYLGAPLSVVISYWIMALGLIVYTIFTKHELKPLKCWNGIIRRDQVFKNWKKMFNLAWPGMLMVEAEFLGFEILTIFASWIDTEALGAQSIMASTASLAYQIPFSLSVSTSTRVANLIGASLLSGCIITCRVSLLLSFCCSSFNSFIIYTFKRTIARLFTNDPAVLSLVAATLPFLAFMQFFDAFNASTAGCLRGQGRQKIGSYINLFAFYCIGIPMAWTLTFKFNFGIAGLWMGITCALVMMSLCQSYAVFHGDWSQILSAAQRRNAEDVRA